MFISLSETELTTKAEALDITNSFKHCCLGLWVFTVQRGNLQEDIDRLRGVGCINLEEQKQSRDPCCDKLCASDGLAQLKEVLTCS